MDEEAYEAVAVEARVEEAATAAGEGSAVAGAEAEAREAGEGPEAAARAEEAGSSVSRLALAMRRSLSEWCDPLPSSPCATPEGGRWGGGGERVSGREASGCHVREAQLTINGK